MCFLVLLKQAWQCSPGKEVAWNLLSLFTASGMLCLEISLMAFLLKDNYMSGMEALAHSFHASGIIVFVDTLLKVRLVFIRISYIHPCAMFFYLFCKYQWIFMTEWYLDLCYSFLVSNNFPFIYCIWFSSYQLLVRFLLFNVTWSYITIAWYITAHKIINQSIGNFAEKESSQLANHHSLISATLITTMIATLF